MSISVITTTYNRPEYLRLFLASLALQTRPADEIVVADDGSSSDSIAAMKQYMDTSGLPCRFVTQEDKGYRLSAARNLGIRASQSDYLVFLDCDVVLLPDSLAAHADLARRRQILCGNRALLDEVMTTRLFDMRPAPTVEDWESAWTSSDASHLPEVACQFAHYAALRRWKMARGHKPKVLGCHFSLFREDVERVNGFDENFEGWGYEDDDFARRLYKTGVCPVDISLTIRTMHLWHPSLAPAALQRHRDRPNRAYFRRWFVPAYCKKGLIQS